MLEDSILKTKSIPKYFKLVSSSVAEDGINSNKVQHRACYPFNNSSKRGRTLLDSIQINIASYFKAIYKQDKPVVKEGPPTATSRLRYATADCVKDVLCVLA